MRVCMYIYLIIPKLIKKIFQVSFLIRENFLKKSRFSKFLEFKKNHQKWVKSGKWIKNNLVNFRPLPNKVKKEEFLK
jgi:hypothetical protein